MYKKYFKRKGEKMSNELRTEKVNIRVTPEERSFLEKLAHQNNVDSLSMWLRKMIMDHTVCIGAGWNRFLKYDQLAILHDNKNKKVVYVSDARGLFLYRKLPTSLFNNNLDAIIMSVETKKKDNILIKLDPASGKKTVTKLDHFIENIVGAENERQEANIVSYNNEPIIQNHKGLYQIVFFEGNSRKLRIQYHYYKLIKELYGTEVSQIFIVRNQLEIYNTAGELLSLVMAVVD